jgi:transposase
MDTDGVEGAVQPPKRSWRRHDLAFKARVIELARQPRASVAAVALANGLNANMLRRWVREAERAAAEEPSSITAPQPPLFVQLPMPPIEPVALAPAAAATTFVEIHREGTCVYVTLPVGIDSAAWLREVLR